MMISFASDGQQKGGDCLLRTASLSDPQSWRAWDGSGFNIAFVSPYSDGSVIGHPQPCTPVGSNTLSAPVRTLARTLSGEFIAVFLKSSAADRPEGAYVSYSGDLVHWGEPKLLLGFNVFDKKRCKPGISLPSYSYPSLIDPSDASRNFNVTGGSAYLYLTRFNSCWHPDRDLVRLKVVVPAKTSN